MRLPQRAVDSTLSTAESYTCIPEGRIKLLQASFPACFRVRLCCRSCPPEGIASASQGARLLHLLLQAFRYIPVLFSMSKFYFVNRWGIEPRPLWGLALCCDLPFSCPFHGFELRGIIITFVVSNFTPHFVC